MQAYIAFLAYVATALILLGVFMFVYEKFTPYREFQEIKAGNMAAAVAFGGAILGFTFPIIASIFFTHSLVEMVIWGFAQGCIQIVLYAIMQPLQQVDNCVKERNVPAAVLLASLSVAVGLISAFSISV